MPGKDDSDKRIQVLSRAIAVIRSLDGRPAGLTLAEVAEATGLPRSTTHRLVTALEADGFLTTNARSGRVHLGAGLLSLASRGQRDAQAELRPIMLELHDAIDETVDLSVLDGDHLRCVDQIPAPHRLRAVSTIGATFPLHCTANGKAALARLDDAVIARTLPGRLAGYTTATIARRADLLTELETIRQTGVAFDHEEYTDGISAVGVAMIDPRGSIFAFSVPVPTLRFEDKEPLLTRALVHAATAAEAALHDMGSAQ